MINLEAARLHWHPVAASSDLVPRHVFHAQILGRELALWRADDGHVNAWENRCLHRGVRLSIGVNDGTELVCQYHGWRYANRTAGCTYIPAHPANAPARTICNNTYPVFEQYGLVWSGETPVGALSDHQTLAYSAMTPLRAIAVNSPLLDIALPLINLYHLETAACGRSPVHYSADTPHPFLIILRAHTGNNVPDTTAPDIAFFLQPVDAARTVIRGVLCGIDETSTDKSSLTAMLWHHDIKLSQLRDVIEQHSKTKAQPAPWVANVPTVSETIASMPALSSPGREAALRVRVSSIKSLSPTVKAFSFHALDDSLTGASADLPAAQPGAHIDVHLPNSQVRQYSLTNGPGQTDHYAIAVKHLHDSTGGSHALHTNLKVGDVLACSVPRNNFTLRRDAVHTFLIAGGIGLTPLLSMARALSHARLPFTLHHFISAESDSIFENELDALHGTIQTYVAQDVQQTKLTLTSILAHPTEHHHVYLCGPPPMLSLARQLAQSSGWTDSAVHFEYFKNTEARDNTTAFTVELSRSDLTLEVPAGQTLLSVLREHDVGVPSSCEQGACGTCRITVLEGEPDHQDVYLSDSDKHKANCMMSCVSRARTKRLVLDL